MKYKFLQVSNVSSIHKTNYPKPDTKPGAEWIMLMEEPHSIQDTYLSQELNIYSLSQLVPINNCKVSWQTEVYFNIGVRHVISFSQGNGFCF